MTDASAAAAPAKATKVKKATKPKVPAAHPKYSDMIVAAVKNLKERNGSSRQAILKYIMANYKVGNDAKKVGTRLRLALQRAVASGILKNSKGTGAAGSFRVTEKAEKPKKKAAAKKAKTPKKAKATGEKKVKKAKTPKKAKAAGEKKAAKPKKAKTPKKAKAPAVKKAAAKKSPAKKAAKPAAKKPAAKKTAKAGAKKAAAKK